MSALAVSVPALSGRPVLAAAGAVVLVAVLALAAWFLRRRVRSRRAAPGAPGPAPTGTTAGPTRAAASAPVPGAAGTPLIPTQAVPPPAGAHPQTPPSWATEPTRLLNPLIKE